MDDANEPTTKTPAAKKLIKDVAAEVTASRRIFDCPSCGHYKPHNPANPMVGGTCRCRPPVPILLGIQQPKVQGMGPMFDVRAFWPTVGQGDWCGQHTATALEITSGKDSIAKAEGR